MPDAVWNIRRSSLISFAKLMKAIKIVWISLSWMEGRVQISHSTDISGCCCLGWAYLSLPSISPNADIIGFQCSTINQGEVLDKRSANRKHFSWKWYFVLDVDKEGWDTLNFLLTFSSNLDVNAEKFHEIQMNSLDLIHIIKRALD